MRQTKAPASKRMLSNTSLVVTIRGNRVAACFTLTMMTDAAPASCSNPNTTSFIISSMPCRLSTTSGKYINSIVASNIRTSTISRGAITREEAQTLMPLKAATNNLKSKMRDRIRAVVKAGKRSKTTVKRANNTSRICSRPSLRASSSSDRRHLKMTTVSTTTIKTFTASKCSLCR